MEPGSNKIINAYSDIKVSSLEDGFSSEEI